MSFPIDVMDDMILRRTDGTFTYNFAVVCDDVNMAITHVIRGDDHLSNTPRQVLIYEALGAEVPLFAHLSMILGPDGKKLSKRHGATNVEEYRDRGYLPDALVNFLALLGWSLDGETTIIPPAELCRTFSLDRITKKHSIFDEKKLDWMNGVYIRDMGAAAWVDAAKPWLAQTQPGRVERAGRHHRRADAHQGGGGGGRPRVAPSRSRRGRRHLGGVPGRRGRRSRVLRGHVPARGRAGWRIWTRSPPSWRFCSGATRWCSTRRASRRCC